MFDPQWLKEGKLKGAKYLIVVCDTFDYSDYPVYAFSEAEKDREVAAHTGNMQRVMETIKL